MIAAAKTKVLPLVRSKSVNFSKQNLSKLSQAKQLSTLAKPIAVPSSHSFAQTRVTQPNPITVPKRRLHLAFQPTGATVEEPTNVTRESEAYQKANPTLKSVVFPGPGGRQRSNSVANALELAHGFVTGSGHEENEEAALAEIEKARASGDKTLHITTGSRGIVPGLNVARRAQSLGIPVNSFTAYDPVSATPEPGITPQYVGKEGQKYQGISSAANPIPENVEQATVIHATEDRRGAFTADNLTASGPTKLSKVKVPGTSHRDVVGAYNRGSDVSTGELALSEGLRQKPSGAFDPGQVLSPAKHNAALSYGQARTPPESAVNQTIRLLFGEKSPTDLADVPEVSPLPVEDERG